MSLCITASPFQGENTKVYSHGSRIKISGLLCNFPEPASSPELFKTHRPPSAPSARPAAGAAAMELQVLITSEEKQVVAFRKGLQK